MRSPFRCISCSLPCGRAVFPGCAFVRPLLCPHVSLPPQVPSHLLPLAFPVFLFHYSCPFNSRVVPCSRRNHGGELTRSSYGPGSLSNYFLRGLLCLILCTGADAFRPRPFPLKPHYWGWPFSVFFSPFVVFFLVLFIFCFSCLNSYFAFPCFPFQSLFVFVFALLFFAF